MQKISLKQLVANMALVCFYGLINGMAVLFSSNSINYWLASNEVNIEIIGLFSLIILPHAFKYLVAIFIESTKIPILNKLCGQLKAWLIFSQISVIATLFCLSHLSPKNNLTTIAFFGFFLSLMAVVQYVILNGNRIQIFASNHQGKGNAIYNIGYRIGMFITGAGVIFLTSFLNWQEIFYTLCIGYFILSTVVVYYYLEPENAKVESWIKENKSIIHGIFIVPIEVFKSFRSFACIFIFILFYQLSDTMLMTMLNSFLLSKNYSPNEIAGASKTCGLIMVIIGGFVGGFLVDKLSEIKSLFFLGLVHSLSYILFLLLSLKTKNLYYLYLATGFGAFTGGMATTAYLSFVSNLAKGSYATTLYALLSSIIGLAWAIFPCFSGIIVEQFSWNFFFIFIFITSLFSSALAFIIPKPYCR